MADVGTDIFGILNTYLTSRQGPLDGKKPPPQGPTPEGPPAAPAPPEPPAGMAPNVAPPAPAPGPPIPTDTRTLAADGGLAQYTQMLKAAQEAQRKAAFGSALARGGASLGAALTRSPSMRESLTSIAGHAGGGGDGSGGGVGNLTPDAFLKFGERADSLAAKGRFAASRGALSKQLGISESALQTMYDTDPKKVADLQAANADPTREVKVLDDGTIMSTRKNAAPGEKPIVLGYDTEKQAEGKRKDIELGLKGKTEQREQAKEGRDAEKFSYERAAQLSSDASIDELSTLINKPPAVLRSMTQDQRAKLITEQFHVFEPTADQKTLAGINAQRKAAGLDEYTTEQWRDLENEKTKDIKRIEAGFGPQATAATTANEKSAEANQAILQTRMAREQARNAVYRGGEAGVYAGGGPLTDWAIKYQKLVTGLTGRQNPKIQNTEIYTASLAADVLSSIHALGTGSAVSDGDRIYAEKAAGGTIELTPELMRRLLAIRDKLDRQKMESNNANIDRRYNALPGLARITEPTALPKQDKEALRYTDNATILNSLSDPDGNKAYFDSLHGKGAQDEFTTKRFDELIQSKMALENTKTRVHSQDDTEQFKLLKKMPLDVMVRDKAMLEQDAINKYGPDQGKGLIDILIAAKQAKKF